MKEIIIAFAGAFGGVGFGFLLTLGTIYKLWPDLYAELRKRVLEEEDDEKRR